MFTSKKLSQIVSNQPYPLLFVTISGAHLYGFPSPDSDYDLRGIHILPIPEVIGLNTSRDTIEVSQKQQDLEIDLVTHDIKKFFSLLLKRNGYVLEQLYSPLIISTTPEHEELKAIATGCITRYHVYHYLGFARKQWRLFEQEQPPKVKPLLYVYRVLLTGIHLMKTGIVKTNLIELNEEFRLPYIGEFITRKLEGGEKSTIPDANVSFHQKEYNRLCAELDLAFKNSKLLEKSSAKNDLNDLLIRLRLNACLIKAKLI
jgi:uncharacterized protein